MVFIIAFTGNAVEAEAEVVDQILKAPEGTGSSAALSAAIIPDTTQTILDHNLVAENDNYQLYLYEPTLSIIIRDKTTGAIMESTVRDDNGKSNATWSGFIQSGISIELQEDNNKLQKKIDLVNSGASVSVSLVAGGFEAKVTYDRYELSFEVKVLLYDDGSITVTIPEESIYENSVKYKIGNFYVYPFLGYTCLGEREGYMLIPDGNGALIYLENKEGRFSEGYSQRVYGTDAGINDPFQLSLIWGMFETHNDPELILAPVYGMVHTDSEMAYLAVIESGAEEATIEAVPNGAYTDYNWITSKYRKSTTYVQPTSNSGGSITKVTDRIAYDIQIKYCFVSKESADYAGLANRYRDYLMEKGELTDKKDDFKIRIDFLGSDVENWLLFKKSVKMTTTDQIREIYDELSEAGVTDILSLYKGWQDGGIFEVPVKSFKAASGIGGNRKLKNLISDVTEQGIQFYLYQDVLRLNPATTSSSFNVIKKMDKRVYSEDVFMEVFDEFNYLLPSKTNANLTKLTKSFLSEGIENMAISGITNTMFTHMLDNVMHTRKETADAYESYISSADEKMNLLLEEPIATLWKHTEAMIDMPVSDSDYIYTDQSVPFLSIVLKGMIPMYSDYVNFEANKTEFFLKLIETGVYPSFYITYEGTEKLIYTNSADIYTSKYSVYKNEMIEYYNELKQVNEIVSGAFIMDHKIMENGVTVVTYDNGVKMYINYGKSVQTVDGITIDSMTYQIGGAE